MLTTRDRFQDPNNTPDPVAEKIQDFIIDLALEGAFSNEVGGVRRDLPVTTARELWEIDDPRYGVEVEIKGRLYRLIIEPRGLASPSSRAPVLLTPQ